MPISFSDHDLLSHGGAPEEAAETVAIGTRLAVAGAISGMRITADRGFLMGTCTIDWKGKSKCFAVAIGDGNRASCGHDKIALAMGECEHVVALLVAFRQHPEIATPLSAEDLLALAGSSEPAVRGLALRRIGREGTPAAMPVLLASLRERPVTEHAMVGIDAMPADLAVPALLDRLAEAEREAATPSRATKQRLDINELGATLLALLGRRHDPRIAAAVLPLISGFGEVAALAALSSADRNQTTAIADLLNGEDHSLFTIAAVASEKLGADEAFGRFTSVFAARDRDSELGRRRMAAVSARLVVAPDPRWGPICLPLLDGSAAIYAAPVLSALCERQAVEPLIARLAEAQHPEDILVYVRALGQIADVRAVDALLRLSAHPYLGIPVAVRIALLAIGDPTSAGRIHLRAEELADRQEADSLHWVANQLADGCKRSK